MARVNTDFGRRHKPEYKIVLLAGVLLLLSVIVIYSISPALSTSANLDNIVTKQLIFTGLGVVAFLIAANIPLNFWKKIQVWLFGFAVVANLAVLIPGVGQESNGASRWIDVGPFNFQPSSVLKFALILYLGTFLYERTRMNKLNNRSETITPVMAVLAILGLLVVVLQKDMGTMIALVTITLAMLWAAEVKFRYMAQVSGVLAAGAALLIAVAPHRLARVVTFINNDVDVEGAGYHINQALIAIGSGGLFGKGLGRSVQVYGYVPEAANDSIFAIVAEKFGFVGSAIVLGIYIALLINILSIANRQQNQYLKLIVIGVFAWILSHIIINMGAMLGLLPLTGITLPLLSLGGSSLILIMAALGLIFNISRYSSIRLSAKQ